MIEGDSKSSPMGVPPEIQSLEKIIGTEYGAKLACELVKALEGPVDYSDTDPEILEHFKDFLRK